MTLQEYKSDVTSIFRRNTYRGFADWRQCGNLEYELINYLDKAAKTLIKANRDKDLFDLVGVSYVKWANTDKDDSNGETQSFVGTAFELWDQIYDRKRPEMPHEKMFAWFMKKMDGSLIDYMEEFILEYVMAHFQEAEIQKEKLNFLNQRIARREAEAVEKSWRRYEAQRCREYVLQIYGEQRRPIDEIREYAKSLTSDSAKERLARIELDYGNRDECITIYIELVNKEDGSPFNKSKYNRVLKNLYKDFGMQEQYEGQVEKLLYIDVGKDDIFEEFKTLVPAEEWEQKRDRLFDDLEQKKRYPLSWYSSEKCYDRLMTGVEQSSIFMLEHYEGDLCQRYPDRCLAMLVSHVESSVLRATQRKQYRDLADCLKWMHRYPGGKETARRLAENYREAYPRKRALLDELTGI